MIRQQRRRIERQWRNIKIGKVCTEFIESNNLFSLPNVIAFQAVKISEDLVNIYNVGVFDSHRFGGHVEFVTTCLFVSGAFWKLDFMQIGFVPDDALWITEEVDIGLGMPFGFLRFVRQARGEAKATPRLAAKV